MKLRAEPIRSGELKPGDLFLCHDDTVKLLYFEQDRWKWTHSIAERVFIRKEASNETDVPVYRITIEDAGPSHLMILCVTAYNALRSYQHGNASPELAEEIADAMMGLLPKANEGTL